MRGTGGCGVAAFVACLAVGLADAEPQEFEDLLPSGLPQWIEKQNCYRASLLGLDAEYITSEDGSHRPLRNVVAELLGFCEAVAPGIGESRGIAVSRPMLDARPVFEMQIEACREVNSARAVVAMLQASLAEGYVGQATAAGSR